MKQLECRQYNEVELGFFPQRMYHKILNHKLLEGSKFGCVLSTGWNKLGNDCYKLTKHLVKFISESSQTPHSGGVCPPNDRAQRFF